MKHQSSRARGPFGWCVAPFLLTGTIILALGAGFAIGLLATSL